MILYRSWWLEPPTPVRDFSFRHVWTMIATGFLLVNRELVTGNWSGTYWNLVLKHKPGGIYNGETFFTRKALNWCAIGDSDRRFIYILAGWPNSQHDARIFASTTLHQYIEDIFLSSKDLRGDAAYINTDNLFSLMGRASGCPLCYSSYP